jgi:hypothetical protein
VGKEGEDDGAKSQNHHEISSKKDEKMEERQDNGARVKVNSME